MTFCTVKTVPLVHRGLGGDSAGKPSCKLLHLSPFYGCSIRFLCRRLSANRALFTTHLLSPASLPPPAFQSTSYAPPYNSEFRLFYDRTPNKKENHTHERKMSAIKTQVVLILLACMAEIGKAYRWKDYVCIKSGDRPSARCKSWSNGTCLYESGMPHQDEMNMMSEMVKSTGVRECNISDGISVGCVNISNSVSTEMEVACAGTDERTAAEVYAIFAALPNGQLRMYGNSLEMNLARELGPMATNIGGVNVTTRVANTTTDRGLEDIFSCSSLMVHKCTTESTGGQYDSKYVAETGKGVTYSRDWQRAPQSAIYLANNEIILWTATCARTVTAREKKQVFKAGGNSVPFYKDISERWEQTVVARCIALNTYTVNTPEVVG